MGVPASNQDTLIGRIARFYRDSIFPNVNHLRGFTRLKKVLESLALRKEPSVDQKASFDAFKQSRNWDNIIIFDACRFDIFEQVTDESEHVVSPASNTPGYIRKVFSGKNLEDCVLVTGNPQFHPEIFKQRTGSTPEEVFHTVFHTHQEEWNDDIGTCMPEDVIDQALTANKLFPEKRLVIWFLQPHHPFINSEVEDPGYKKQNVFDGESEDYTVWDLAEKHKVNHQKVVESYVKNLSYALEEVKSDLIGKLSGKTWITSDHGNFVGEAGYYGHPPYHGEEAVRKVPLKIVGEEKDD